MCDESTRVDDVGTKKQVVSVSRDFIRPQAGESGAEKTRIHRRVDSNARIRTRSTSSFPRHLHHLQQPPPHCGPQKERERDSVK